MYKKQDIFYGKSFDETISNIIEKWSDKFLLVCDSSYNYLEIKKYFDKCSNAVIFNEFSSNPLYEDVCKGVDLFRKEKCSNIIAIGGGSSIDVAKCIKLFSSMNDNENYLKQEFRENSVKLLAIPTTAGTGSESTRFAVIYYNGEKQSVTLPDIIPDYVILEPSVLDTLPVYQRKCTLMDALCQAIESYWSVNSTDESKEYSRQAISLILPYYHKYVSGDNEHNDKILLASNYAGKAINISQTTAAHAMSYKITSIFKLPHGHAVAICLPKLWNYMLNHSEIVTDNDERKKDLSVFTHISELLGCDNSENAVRWIENLLNELELNVPENVDDKTIDKLAASVNPVRLKNNPVKLSENDLKQIYINIFNINK